jgi:hypothetical protein
MKTSLYILFFFLCNAAVAQSVPSPSTAATMTTTAATTMATTSAGTNIDICSSKIKALPDDAEIKLIHGPVQEAIATLDNAQIAFSSPTLASDKLNYLTISPNFVGDANNLGNICILGYFEQGSSTELFSAPFDVDHIEVVKIPNKDDPTKFSMSTRVFFRAPDLAEFSNPSYKDSFIKFWSKHQPVILHVAAFEYKDGTRVKSYMGRDVPVSISYKKASLTTAVLFFLFCYFSAAFTISYSISKTQNMLPTNISGVRLFFKKLSPWCIVGSSGQASLSQLQMFLFTMIVATLLFYQWIRTGLLQEISTDLLYLIGISTLGAGGNEITKSIKKNLDAEVYAYVQQMSWFTAPMERAHLSAHPSELLLTNDRFDIYKFQMLVFTFVIAAYVIASGANELGNIQISSTLLTLMGMSQGVYIGGHATADNLTPFQDQIRGMQAMQQQYVDAANSPEQQAVIAKKFRSAAVQAAEMFTNIFHRDIPASMMHMPTLHVSAPAAEKSAPIAPDNPEPEK